MRNVSQTLNVMSFFNEEIEAKEKGKMVTNLGKDYKREQRKALIKFCFERSHRFRNMQDSTTLPRIRFQWEILREISYHVA